MIFLLKREAGIQIGNSPVEMYSFFIILNLSRKRVNNVEKPKYETLYLLKQVKL